MKPYLRHLLPASVKKTLKTLYHYILDSRDFLIRRAPKTVPPRRLNFVGSEDFEAVGKEFFHHFLRFIPIATAWKQRLGTVKNG